MPLKDGKGPQRGGSGIGGGRGGGRGGGKGGGRMGGSFSAGTGGNCMCPNCGATSSHERGVPCNQITCPKCGAIMTREINS
ncbi:MAG: hypothetical protein JXB48_16565 [Candidatus Latescibacteria bacterium]|nr:hypothetical protein [Candidatus Latescibacterota bacterium]